MKNPSATRRTVIVAWAATTATAIVYLLLGGVLDDALAGRHPAATTLLAGLAAALLAGLASAHVLRTGARRQGRIESEIRRAVVATVLDLGPANLTREQTGKVVSTATDAGERVGLNRGTFVAPALASVTSPVLILAIVAAVIDWRTALWLLIAIPVAPLAIGGFQMLFRKSSAAYRVSSRRLAASFLDSIQGLTTLRLLGAGERRAHELARASEDVRRKVMRMLFGNQMVILAADTVFWMGFVGLAAWLAAERTAAGAITPGEGVALVLLATLLLEPLVRIGQFFYIGMAGRAAAKEVDRFVAQRPLVEQREEREDAAAPQVEPAGIAVDLEHVAFTYPDGTSVLTDVDLHLAPGERVALVGRSGEGKSTIADLLQGLWLPTDGVLRLGGVATAEMSAASIRKHVAVVSQSTYLFTGSLAENLRLARPDASDEELWEALETAALADVVRAMPAGLDTPVGERGLSLSGGQAQRLAIARAVLRDAPLLLLDEPTAQIDLASERDVVEALDRASYGRTVLTITHRTTAIGRVDRVVRLDAGAIRDVDTAPATAGTHTPTTTSTSTTTIVEEIR